MTWYHRDGTEAPVPTSVGKRGVSGHYIEGRRCFRRGFRLWGTVPRALVNELVDAGAIEWLPSARWGGEWEMKGTARVTFVANVETSGRDPLFGFWKRPRKGAVLGVEERGKD